MSSPRRFFLKDNFYHVFNRGNRKNNIFLEDRDYSRFLERLGIYKDKFQVDVLCYCLMPNHFHLLLKQKSDLPISSFILPLATGYSKYFNLKYDEVGSLFQGRFKAKLIETDAYLVQVSRYIHLNPTKLTENPVKYKWSSFKDHLDPSKKDKLTNSDYILSYFNSANPHKDYGEFVLADHRDKIEGQVRELMIDL